MKHLILSAAFAMFLGNPQLEKQYLAKSAPIGQDPQLPKIAVVDKTAIPWKGGTGATKLVLGVDSDDCVRIYSWDEEKGKPATKPRITRYLGQRLRESGGLPLRGLLPRTEVPVLAHRITHGATRYHVIVTSGFDKYEPTVNPNPSYNLYVVAENLETRQARVVEAQEQAGGELRQFLAQDMSRNGQLEVIDVSLDGETETGTVRLLSTNGQLKVLQTFDGDGVYFTSEDQSLSSQYQLVVEEKDYGCTVGPCVTHKMYVWSPTKNRFVASAFSDRPMGSAGDLP